MKLWKVVPVVTALVLSSSVNAALVERLGGLAYYDDNLNITWATDVIVTGRDTWANQTAWAESLTLGGITGWRLPNVDVNGDGNIAYCQAGNDSECLDNELGYQLLRNSITIDTPVPFTNFDQSGLYVSSTIYASDPSFVWDVSISATRGVGSFAAHTITSPAFFAWAVHDGDVAELSSVPLPAAALLFGSGLIGLAGIARRKKA